ncbi:MAG: TonB C-terminal domain-containing protein [Gemmatimonadota bacterium]
MRRLRRRRNPARTSTCVWRAYVGTIRRTTTTSSPRSIFRWTGEGNWETTVYFVIRSDGTVADLDFVKKSGNAAFDYEAMGAVDCAGKGRFGALPEDLPFDRLPVQFNFRPQGGIRGFFPDPVTVTSDVGSER